jgi:hypothetical protein
MNHSQNVPSTPSTSEIETRFNAIWPELQSRAKAMSRRYSPDEDEAESEALASMSANFVNAARKGKWLPPTMLAHYAAIRLRVGRTLTGNAVNEPLSALCRIRNKSSVVSLSDVRKRRRDHGSTPTHGQRLADVLTSNIRENPFERCATKLDWAAFVATQPSRIQRVLAGLAEGFSRKEMAHLIGVSQCRLTQLMDRVKLAVLEFFGDTTPDFMLPAAA